jgi:hypothetical protein
MFYTQFHVDFVENWLLPQIVPKCAQCNHFEAD